MSEPWLSADDMAPHLGVASETVHVLAAERSRPAEDIRRMSETQASDVDAWVRDRRAARPAPMSKPMV